MKSFLCRLALSLIVILVIFDQVVSACVQGQLEFDHEEAIPPVTCEGGLPVQLYREYFKQCDAYGEWSGMISNTRQHVLGVCCNGAKKDVYVGYTYKQRCNGDVIIKKRYKRYEGRICTNYQWVDDGSSYELFQDQSSIGECGACLVCTGEGVCTSNDSESCDDGDSCTENDYCSGGSCRGQAPMSPIDPACE